MERTPAGGARIRYDHPNTGDLDELGKLDDLIKFLDTVGPNARLRAKEESGMKFLHTRTGTPIGRFLKWMTIAWPEARQQRVLVREFVRDTLKDIGGKEKYGDSVNKLLRTYKEDILNTTLKVRSFSEFNIAELKIKLEELKKLAAAKRIDTPSRNDPGSDTSSIPQTDEAPTVNSVSNDLPEDLSEQSDLENDAESDIEDDHEVGREAPRSVVPEKVDLDEKIPASSLPESLPSPPGTHPEKQPSVSPASIETAVVLNEHADEKAELQAASNSNEAPVISADENVVAESNVPISFKPASSVKPLLPPVPTPARLRLDGQVVGESTFAQFKISSSSAKFGTTLAAYQADAYILPKTDSLNLTRGKTELIKEEPAQNGVAVSLKTQTIKPLVVKNTVDEVREIKREFAQLSLTEPDNPQNSEEYENKLENLYRSALQQAIDAGAQTLAIKPFHSTGDEKLTDLSIRALVKALESLEKLQPAPAILTMLSGNNQITYFNRLKNPDSKVSSTLNSFS